MNKNELVTKMSELSGLTKVDSNKGHIKHSIATHAHIF